MVKHVPMNVFPLMPGQWEVWVGTGKKIGVFDRKDRAIEVAMSHANSNNLEDMRPGVVVWDSDGEYQRFEANGEFWEYVGRS